MICGFCGYDFKTGAMSKSFNPQAKPGKKKGRPGGLVSPQIKKFAFIGILIVLASVSYKYIFSLKSYIFTLRTIVLDFARPIIEGKTGEKRDKGRKEASVTKKTTKKYADNALRIEGISYDPEAKSFIAVNGKLVSEGETIRGVIVERIDKDSVMVLIEGEEKVFTIGQTIPLPKKK